MDDLLKLLSEIIPEADFENDDNWVESGLVDSLEIVEIVDEIEKKYGITIKPDDIDPDNFMSIETLWRMVSKYIA